jgi:uncharacterized membrane protein
MSNLVKPAFMSRWILWRTEIDRILSASMLFSLFMTVSRSLITGKLAFLWLLWNLFLAYIPYALTSWLSLRPEMAKKNHSFLLFFVVWLLFIPNTFYIITDLFHLGGYRAVPLWFDLFLLFSFAWNGLLLGVLSVRQMEKIMVQRVGLTREWLFLYPIMLLNALGVYIGRYLRFNSWDVVTDPVQLLKDIADLILHPFQYRMAWAMVSCFSVLMTLMYITLKKLSKAIH